MGTLNQQQIADRRDYVVTCVAAPIPASTGPVQFTVTLDTDFPWMWTGLYLGSVFSSTSNGSGGLIQVLPSDLSIQILDSNRDYLFSDFLPVDTIQYAITSSNIGQNRNEIFVLNPEQPQPPGGSMQVFANNLNADGNLFFELVFTGYKIKDECLRATPPGKYDLHRNLRRAF